MRAGRQGSSLTPRSELIQRRTRLRIDYLALQIFHSQKFQKMVGAIVIGATPASFSL